MPAPRLLDTVKPLLPFIPRVEAPLGGRVDVTERAIWTAATLALYLSLLSFPLFGAHEQHQQHGMDTPDAWAHLRNIVAAKRGTLGALGVVPVVTAAVGMQAAAAYGWLDVDFGRREDRAVFGAAQKGEWGAFSERSENQSLPSEASIAPQATSPKDSSSSRARRMPRERLAFGFPEAAAVRPRFRRAQARPWRRRLQVRRISSEATARELVRLPPESGVVLAIGIAFIQTVFLILSGEYGPLSSLSPVTILLILFQLCGSTLLTLILDEIVTSGYGIGSGISNFIAGATASTILSSTLSLSWIPTIGGPQYQGSLVALFYALVKSHSKSRALKLVFYRDYLPNVWGFLTTALLFLAVVFIQSFRTEVALKNMRARGMRVNYPVKLLYTSSIPLIIAGTLASHLFFASHTLYSLLPGNLVSRLITGAWQPLSEITHPATHSALTTGLLHLLTPPTSIVTALLSPIHTVIYAATLIASTALISRAWIHISGSGPQELAKQFKDQQLVVAGHREGSMVRELKKVVPTAAMSGAAVLAALAVVGDIMGVYGGGIAFVATACTIYNLFELGMKEIMGPDMPGGGMGDLLM
ncbi:hypothetical protein QFC24_003705 [Naganishia onofrii]|uniref:Uncharacterized protein n=1 Tax=Naganishia onofrii TaxID=1851511 RepID=A0ACC2XKC4_9TREE|nr:hypothetical protein QFC24_003705 [Naganishia onofrii]